MNSTVAHELGVHEDRPTVLVVEDEVLIRLMIAEELRKQGLNVVEASNADEALSVLQSAVSVCLLFTDLQMPGDIDGSVLAGFVHATFPKMKIVVASGQQPGSDLLEVADAIFLKPYDPAAVAVCVKELAKDSKYDAKQQQTIEHNRDDSCRRR